MRKMSQLTIRFGAELSRRIQSLAQAEGVSLNQAALRLLRRGAGLAQDGPGKDRVGGALDTLAGTWTPEEERQFLKTQEPFRAIDESMWQ
jgi:hypothetical protein